MPELTPEQQRILSQLQAEYQAVSRALEAETNPRTRARLEAQLRQVEEDIQTAEQGGVVAIAGTAQTIVEQLTQYIQQPFSPAEEAERARANERRRLAEGVRNYAQALAAVVAEQLGAGQDMPYRGLYSYDLQHANLFFGRDEAIEEVLEHLERHPLTVLQSESGAGKTSLLKAGVAPRLLQAGDLPVVLRPYDTPPGQKLKEAFLPDLAPTPWLAQAPLREFLHQALSALGDRDLHLHVILDQFEEFFNVLPDEDQRKHFVDELADCLEDATLRVRWVLALRSEAFGDLAAFQPRISRPFDNAYRLNRLTPEETRQAIVLPAARHGVFYEERLPQRLVQDLQQPGGDVSPPQLQLVCLALFNAHRDRRVLQRAEPAGAAAEDEAPTITHALYEAENGVQGILGNHLERVLRREVPAGERRAARQVIEALVTSRLSRVLRTRDELLADLASQGVDAATADDVLSRLVNSFLVRVEEVGEEETALAYELAHEYILREIELDPETQSRKAAQEVLDREVRDHRLYGSLLSAEKLAAIEAQRDLLRVDQEAQDLIDASRRRLAWQRQRALVALAAAGGGAALLVLRLFTELLTEPSGVLINALVFGGVWGALLSGALVAGVLVAQEAILPRTGNLSPRWQRLGLTVILGAVGFALMHGLLLLFQEYPFLSQRGFGLLVGLLAGLGLNLALAAYPIDTLSQSRRWWPLRVAGAALSFGLIQAWLVAREELYVTLAVVKGVGHYGSKAFRLSEFGLALASQQRWGPILDVLDGGLVGAALAVGILVGLRLWAFPVRWRGRRTRRAAEKR